MEPPAKPKQARPVSDLVARDTAGNSCSYEALDPRLAKNQGAIDGRNELACDCLDGHLWWRGCRELTTPGPLRLLELSMARLILPTDRPPPADLFSMNSDADFSLPPWAALSR
jgi:hypothetical protein